MAFQLRVYLDLFSEVTKQKFGRAYDFAALEAQYREHASGRRQLTAKDVSKLFSPDNAPFGKYWPRPHSKVL